MVEIVTLPLLACVSDHQTVLVRGFVLGVDDVKAQSGVGSVNSSVVAAKLSTVLVKSLEITVMALEMLSFCGGAAVTVNVFAEDCPAFRASLVTVIEATVP